MLLIEIKRGWATDFKAARSNDIKLIKKKICVSIRDWNINQEKPIAQNLKVWPGCLAPFFLYIYIFILAFKFSPRNILMHILNNYKIYPEAT